VEDLQTPNTANDQGAKIADHAITVQKTARMIERVFKGTGLNIAIQDGGSAGQTYFAPELEPIL